MKNDNINITLNKKYHVISYDDMKEHTRSLLSKELDIKANTSVQNNYGAWKESCAMFNREVGLDIPRQTFKNFFFGARFNLPFVYLFSQYVNKPMTYFFGNRVFYNEQSKIFNHYKMMPIDNIATSDTACALPFDQVTNPETTKVSSLPNDIRHYRKGSMCLIDISKTTNTETGIYLVKDSNGQLQAIELSETGKTSTIGKIKSVLCAV